MSSLTAARARPCAACVLRIQAAAVSSSHGGIARARYSNSLATNEPVAGPSRQNARFQSIRHFTSTIRVSAGRKSIERERSKHINMEEFPPERIRNLSIIAHIDHGKSTLADRLLQMTNTVPTNSSPQFLDKLKVERERGITVKAQTVSIIHQHTDGQRYLINLIDTPGHVDFSYEVSRSLGACEGGLLLVDCTQGIQAQTLSVFHVAIEADLTLLAVINKVDLSHASPAETSEQIESTLGLEAEKHMRISAKTGLGVDEVLNQIIEGLPPPRKRENDDGKLRGLVFDTYYDHFRGVVALVRIMSGSVKVGDKIRFLQASKRYEVLEVGVNNPEEIPVDILKEGQVGYLICSMKNSEEAFIGDTICLEKEPVEPLPGFKPMKAMVYAGVFPMDSGDFGKLEEAIERLILNDRSVTVARESSTALSQGFRLGFLGTLHMDVFRQRLEDEYSSNVIVTAPTVPYKVTFTNGKEALISNPSEFPDYSDGRVQIQSVKEPMVHSTIMIPNDYLGAMMDLCARYRATQLEYKVLETTGRSMLRYSFPLAEIVTDFFSELKSASSGFASFDYEEAGYETSDIARMNIMLNGKPVDALSMIVHRSAAHSIGKVWVKKMKDVVPRQQYEVAIQAAIGSKVVARETLSATRKDVTAGLYGGHFERKLKHLNKQKEGKKRLKRLAGSIDVPQSAFFDALSSRPRSYSTAPHRNLVDDSPDPVPPLEQSEQHMNRDPFDFIAPYLPGTIPFMPPVQESKQHQPLAPHSISPQNRSALLSRLHRLSTSPPGTVTPDELFSAYTDTLHPNSNTNALTPTELRETLAALSRLNREVRSNRRVVQSRVMQITYQLRDVVGEENMQSDSLRALFANARSFHRPRPRDIHRAEQKVLNLQGQLEERDKGERVWRSSVGLQHSLNHLLYLCAMTGNLKKFDQVWESAKVQGFQPDSYSHLAVLILLERVQQMSKVPMSLKQALADIKDNQGRTVLANAALAMYAEHGRWGVVSYIYSTLQGDLTRRLPYPLDSANDNELEIPVDISPSRKTYSLLMRNLAMAGYLETSLQIMKDMQEAEHTPFILEYAALFEGFALYGVSKPPVKGDISYLFPVIRKSKIGRARKEVSKERHGAWSSSVAQIWTNVSRGRSSNHSNDDRLANPWTENILQGFFEALLALRPGLRDVPYSHQAPSPHQVWIILLAFSRMSGGDADVVRTAYEALHDKFGHGEALGEERGKWIGWKLNNTLERVSKGLYGREGDEGGV